MITAQSGRIPRQWGEPAGQSRRTQRAQRGRAAAGVDDRVADVCRQGPVGNDGAAADAAASGVRLGCRRQAVHLDTLSGLTRACLHSSGPEEGGDKVDHSGETGIGLFIARGDTSNALMAQKKFSTR